MIGGRDHGDIAVTIRSLDRHTQPAELGQQQRRRMPVVVVQPDRNHRHSGVHGSQEPRIGVRASVVRNLQHVGPEVDARVKHSLLLLHLRVARKQYTHATQRRP
jgi:hypothetical protein